VLVLTLMVAVICMVGIGGNVSYSLRVQAHLHMGALWILAF
jgi:hypothetical protein